MKITIIGESAESYLTLFAIGPTHASCVERPWVYWQYTPMLPDIFCTQIGLSWTQSSPKSLFWNYAGFAMSLIFSRHNSEPSGFCGSGCSVSLNKMKTTYKVVSVCPHGHNFSLELAAKGSNCNHLQTSQLSAQYVQMTRRKRCYSDIQCTQSFHRVPSKLHTIQYSTPC